MAAHAEDSLRGSSIAQIFDLALTIAASKAGCTEGLITRQDGEILDFVVAGATAVGAVVANEGAVTEQEQIRIGIKKRATRVATEAIQMPSIARYHPVSKCVRSRMVCMTAGTIGTHSPSSKAFPSSKIY